MSDKTATSLFMFSPLTSKYAGFYQQLVKGLGNYEQLGNKLIQLAEQAHAFRQFDKVNEIGLILSNLPSKEHQTIGLYFLAVAANSMGNGDQDRARKFFELVVDTAPLHYKAKAILSLAAISAHKADFDSELRYIVEGARAAPNFAITLSAYRGIAIVKAKEGYHKHALKDLERIQPLVKFAPPLIYFDYLNSLAVELGEAGRKDEARNIIKHVLASPFAPAYPEWQETARDLREPNRAFIQVPQIESEYVEMKEVVSQLASKLEQPDNVVPFKLKEAPEPIMPEPLTPQENRGLPLSEKRELILAAIRASELSEFEYDKFMVSLGLLKGGPAEDILDLEDEETLDDMIVIWADHIGAEALAGVLSALRDCEDSFRRNELLDRMIRKAFQRSDLSGLTEEAWRLRVERRLPKK